MVMKKADIWMPLYIGDYLADTAHLSTEEHGAYLLLLMQAWMSDGLLPDDDARLMRICRVSADRWKESGPYIRQFFVKTKHGLRHKRIDVELAKSEAIANQKSVAGKASAAKRALQREAQRNGNENSTPVEQPLNERTNGDSNGAATEGSTETQREVNPSPLPLPSIQNPHTKTVNIVGIQGAVDSETGEILDSDDPFAPALVRRVK